MAIGLALGLLGGGGSILAVPLLVYVAGLPAKAAIATSLLVVGFTALVAMVSHARCGHVEWRTGLIFSATAMFGAFGGGFAAQWFSGSFLLLLFAAMMVATGLAMFREKKNIEARPSHPQPAALVIAEGLVVGAATGLVGAGGGFLVVPALVLLGGMEMHKAIGTSLLVIALKSFAAFAGHVAHVSIDFQMTLVVTLGAVVGSLIGAALSRLVSGQALQKVFGGFVLMMAAYIVGREAGLEFAVVTFALSASVLGRWHWTRSKKISVDTNSVAHL